MIISGHVLDGVFHGVLLGDRVRYATWAMTLPMPRAKCPDKQKLPLARGGVGPGLVEK